MKNLHGIKYMLNFASVIKKQTLIAIKHTHYEEVYSYRHL